MRTPAVRRDLRNKGRSILVSVIEKAHSQCIHKSGTYPAYKSSLKDGSLRCAELLIAAGEIRHNLLARENSRKGTEEEGGGSEKPRHTSSVVLTATTAAVHSAWPAFAADKDYWRETKHIHNICE